MSTEETLHSGPVDGQGVAPSPAPAAPLSHAHQTSPLPWSCRDNKEPSPTSATLPIPFPPRISSLTSPHASPSCPSLTVSFGDQDAATGLVPFIPQGHGALGSLKVGGGAGFQAGSTSKDVQQQAENVSLPMVAMGGWPLQQQPRGPLSTSCQMQAFEMRRVLDTNSSTSRRTMQPTASTRSRSALLASGDHHHTSLAQQQLASSSRSTMTMTTTAAMPMPTAATCESSSSNSATRAHAHGPGAGAGADVDEHVSSSPSPSSAGPQQQLPTEAKKSALSKCPTSGGDACLAPKSKISNNKLSAVFDSADDTASRTTVTANPNPNRASTTTSVLFHRAASFLNKFAGSSAAALSTGPGTPLASQGSNTLPGASASGKLRRQPSLPSALALITASPHMPVVSSSETGSPTFSTHSTPSTPIMPTIPRDNAEPSSPAQAPLLVSLLLFPSSQTERSAQREGPGLHTASAASDPPPTAQPLLTDASHWPEPQQPPPTSPRPASIRSITSTSSKHAPSIKVPAKKRFGWSRRFFRFKNRPPTDPPTSSAPTSSALDPISDSGESGSPPITCSGHSAPFFQRDTSPTQIAPSCCIASPRLAMSTALAHATTPSNHTPRPLLVAGAPVRPTTPSIDPERCRVDPIPPESPTSPTRRREGGRPVFNSPNPTSISRSTSLASSARRHPRLERVHPEDRHDPSALAHRFQLAMSAAASDILVRNYRKSPRALVVALYSATLLQDVDLVAGDTDSGHGGDEMYGENQPSLPSGALDGSEPTELADSSQQVSDNNQTGGPAFMQQFQDLLTHPVVPPQLLLPPGTAHLFAAPPSDSTSPRSPPPAFCHATIVCAELGLVTPPESPMTPPPPTGPVRTNPGASSASSPPLTTSYASTKPRKDTDPNDAYALKVAHMLLTHHLAVACLSVIQSIDRLTLMSVLARPRDRVPKLVLHCPSSHALTPSFPTAHHPQTSTSTSLHGASRALDRAALDVQSAIDRAARGLHARFVECAQLRCPPRTKPRRSPGRAAAAPPPVTGPPSAMAFLYMAVLRGVRLMAYVAAADRELRWTWAGRDVPVQLPGMVAAVDGWVTPAAVGNARVVFSVVPGLVLVTDDPRDPLVDPVRVPGDIGHGAGQSRASSVVSTLSSGASSARSDDEALSDASGQTEEDDDDNVPLWPPLTRPSSVASSTGSTATVQSSSHANVCRSRAHSPALDDFLPRGRVLVPEQVFMVPVSTDLASPTPCPMPYDPQYRTSPVVGRETSRRRAPPTYLAHNVPGSDPALWRGGRRVPEMSARPTTMPVFPTAPAFPNTPDFPLACRTPSPTPTHRLSFGSDTTVVIGDACSDMEDLDVGTDAVGAMSEDAGWVDIAHEVFRPGDESVSPPEISERAGMARIAEEEWRRPSPVRPSATAMLREALALEWRTMMP